MEDDKLALERARMPMSIEENLEIATEDHLRFPCSMMIKLWTDHAQNGKRQSDVDACASAGADIEQKTHLFASTNCVSHACAQGNEMSLIVD